MNNIFLNRNLVAASIRVTSNPTLSFHSPIHRLIPTLHFKSKSKRSSSSFSVSFRPDVDDSSRRLDIKRENSKRNLTGRKHAPVEVGRTQERHNSAENAKSTQPQRRVDPTDILLRDEKILEKPRKLEFGEKRGGAGKRRSEVDGKGIDITLCRNSASNHASTSASLEPKQTKANKATKDGDSKNASREQITASTREKEPWQIQKQALKEKFGEKGWNPRKKLSPDTIIGIRALHDQYPEIYPTPVLAEQFKVSPEAIRRILKSTWRPPEEKMLERRERWARRHDRIWDIKAEIGLRPKRMKDKTPVDPVSTNDDEIEEKLRQAEATKRMQDMKL